MRPIRQFHSYTFWFIVLLGIEIAIARYAHDDFVRPFVGDLLVIVLLYCLLTAFCALSSSSSNSLGIIKRVMMVVIIAFVVEFLQLWHITTYLGLSKYPLLQIVLGNTFDPKDLLAYSLGGVCVLGIEGALGYRSKLRGT